MREEMMEVVAKEVAALRAEVEEFLFFVDFVKKLPGERKSVDGIIFSIGDGSGFDEPGGKG